MRILHVITTINRGGAENHLASLVEGQARTHKVSIAYLKGDGYWTSRFREMGASTVNLGMGFYGDPAPLLRLRSVIRAWSPDLLHAHLPPAELYARLALLGTSPERLPMVISKHNDESFFKKPGHRLVGRWVARRAGRIIAISRAVGNYMRTQGMVDRPGKLATIHYGLDAECFAPKDAGQPDQIRSGWGVGSDEYLVGTVARLVPQKSLHVLLDGFARYLAQAKRPARLVMVGKGPLESELKSQAESLGLGDRIIWAGFREDIPSVMRSLDVFALTSSYEGFGLVLLEAMAAGRAVVGTRVSAIPEVVDHGKTGILVSPGDSMEVAEALLALEDPATRGPMGAEGRIRASGCFSLERMLESTEDVYKAMLAGAE